ncbi:hypothetical protein BATDEDRAFT_88143 [Batrachochytrium dendrobatidis JAM81]|uniref:Uncharacterized protein n=1 Tax=Batrachochytrium dendrobatidis (strain JAM81 / FGSC 10211) TaxID=684364 RepID=F4P297_BATDJ|nr:uncharacterized protein BATDEDRAFT_88143 [Batrachochytrium dendrobatidis JAM81]EGF81077.1 hypothetical protein BATDEDRAFT_88143 [Batrachochytrium dendrobatidis JAM81]|eukprot:XP_006678808.1 hypothetical protein BATDEDRAFT_88143 [Batrachochytrium dendrobatidis JAM81]
MDYEEVVEEEFQVDSTASYGQHLIDTQVSTSPNATQDLHLVPNSPSKNSNYPESPSKQSVQPVSNDDTKKPPSIAKDLSAFTAYLVDLLVQIPMLSEDQLAHWMKYKLKPLCVVDSHNFLFIQALLKQLSNEWHDGIHIGFPINRILEELQTLAASNQEAQMLSDIVKYSDDLPLDVVTSLISIHALGKPTAGDIIKLHRAYKGLTPPPVELLRSFTIMNALIADCFIPGRSNNYRQEKLWLLAYASATIVSSPDPTIVDTKAVIPLYEQLEAFDGVLIRVTSMAQMQDQLVKFFSAIDEPVLSMGLLHWIKQRLFDPDFYEWISFTLGDAPPIFYILDEMAIRNPEQRSHVFSVWKMLFEHEYQKITPLVAIQFRERFLDHFILLIKTGFVLPIFTYLTSNAHQIDDSLLLYFLNTLLSQIDTPHDPTHVWMIIDLLDHISSTSQHDQTAIQQFLEHAIKLDILPDEQLSKAKEILECL